MSEKCVKYSDYSYVSNKRTCAFILFETFMQTCTALFEPARLLIVEVTILPARLLKPRGKYMSQKCKTLPCTGVPRQTAKLSNFIMMEIK